MSNHTIRLDWDTMVEQRIEPAADTMTKDQTITLQAAEIERLRDAEVIARTTQANLHSEIDRLRELVRQVVRSSWPPPPSWYAEAQEAAMLESGEFVRSPTAIPRDDDGAA